MAEHLTRKDLKTDNVAAAVESTVDYFGLHRQTIIRALAGVVVVGLLITGLIMWMSHEKEVRQERLSEAQLAAEASVGASAQPGVLSYPSQEAKDAAVLKVYTDVAAQNKGSNEGAIAEFNLGGIAAGSGKNEEARRHYLAAIDSGSKEYASLAKLALADLNFSDNRAADGEKLLRGLMDSPTALVSKEQATIALAHHLTKTQPAVARTLLEPLRTVTGAVGQAATAAYGEIAPK